MKSSQVIMKDANMEEMIGVLTAISIVSKRLANRLTQLDGKKGEAEHEQNQKIPGCDK